MLIEEDIEWEPKRVTTPFNLLQIQGISKHRENGVALINFTPLELREQSYNLWTEIVEQYTRARLTKERDKLIAISAIAREMQPLMQSRYLAGLWESDLIQQLAWFDYGSGKSSMYCAPSWSWASTTSSVLCCTYTRDCYPLMEIVNANIELDGSDEFGPVKAGYLDILGQLFPAKLQIDNYPYLQNGFGVEGWGIPRRFSSDLLEGPLYCMPLYLQPSSGKKSLYFRTLVLQQCDLPTVYRRVGCVEDYIDPYPTTENPCPELLGKLDWPENTDPTFTRNTTGITSIRLV